VLNDQKKEFECKAFYDGKSASQKYELNRRSFSTKISIIPPKGIDVVPINSINAILVKKNQALNLTCVAPVGCNDINYDIKFVTNLTVIVYIENNKHYNVLELKMNSSFKRINIKMLSINPIEASVWLTTTICMTLVDQC